MEKQTEKIKRFSKVVCILLTITYITLIAVIITEALAWPLSTANLHTQVVMINGVEMEVPVLFKIGGTSVRLPFIWKSGFDFTGIPILQGFFSTVGFADILAAIFALICVRFAKKVFKLLREDGSPFRENVVKSTRRLAIFLLLMGGVSGIVPFIAAGIVGVFCLIFDYGRMLQNESDTTL